MAEVVSMPDNGDDKRLAFAVVVGIFGVITALLIWGTLSQSMSLR
jgi:hypothetical protein